MRPYKVVAYEPGAANVVDRATDEVVGYVLATFAGWEGFLLSARGVSIAMGRFTYPKGHRLREVFGPYRDATEVRTRAEAAAKVWEASR